MHDVVTKLRNYRSESKIVNKLYERLLCELDDYSIGAVERVDRISVLKDLMLRQAVIRAEDTSARKALLKELRPASAWTMPREPTAYELNTINWEEVDQQDKRNELAQQETRRRRRAVLDRLLREVGLEDSQKSGRSAADDTRPQPIDQNQADRHEQGKILKIGKRH